VGIFVGLDVGGTKCMAAAAVDGKIVTKVRYPTPENLDEGLGLLQRMTTEVAQGQKIRAIGAAVGGPLDWQTGIVSPLHQPEWNQVPLCEIFQNRFGCPFYVDVDTNVAAWGEFKYGRHNVDSLFYMTMSTGVGGGFIHNGRLFRGAGGEHPEVGHHAIPARCTFPDRVKCDCGARFCAESLISGTGIERIYNKPGEALTPDEWAEVSWNLGQVLRNIASFYAPAVIALGGGVAVGGGQEMVEMANKAMLVDLKLVTAPEIKLSTLGYDTALYGALALAEDGHL